MKFSKMQSEGREVRNRLTFLGAVAAPLLGHKASSEQRASIAAACLQDALIEEEPMALSPTRERRDKSGMLPLSREERERGESRSRQQTNRRNI